MLSEGDLWKDKVKRRGGHFEGAVLKCIRAGKMTEPNRNLPLADMRGNCYGITNGNVPISKA